MRHLIRHGLTCVCALLLAGLAVLSAAAQVNVTTYHYDNSRTGQNNHETVLTPSVVNSSSFGKIFSQPVDGQIYAEPLVVTNLPVGGSLHTVVFVATENDSVYAFDGNSNTGTNASPLWKTSFINPAKGITTVPSSDFGTTAISPQVGITGTPVIDPSNDTLYVVAATKESGVYYQRLHALDVRTGVEKFGGPVVISAKVPGTGSGSVGGYISFDPFHSNQRPALLLLNGVVYISWASHGLEAKFIYHGWVIGYNETTLAETGAFCVTANGDQGGIWQSGNGLAADALGNIYFLSGNGTFDGNTSGVDFGMSYVKLSAGTMKVADYFTPFNEAKESSGDKDLGSGGALLLPYQSGSNHYLGVGAGKDGNLYLVNRNHMGKFNSQNNSQIVQEIANAFAGHSVYSSPGYWNGFLYYWATQDYLRIFQLNAGKIGTTPVATSTFTLASPGATPVISSNGNTNAILWALDTSGSNVTPQLPAVLHALDAQTAAELYNSTQAGSRDTPGNAVRFTLPTVANGKVYVGTASELDVYGLLQ